MISLVGRVPPRGESGHRIRGPGLQSEAHLCALCASVAKKQPIADQNRKKPAKTSERIKKSPKVF